MYLHKEAVQISRKISSFILISFFIFYFSLLCTQCVYVYSLADYTFVYFILYRLSKIRWLLDFNTFEYFTIATQYILCLLRPIGKVFLDKHIKELIFRHFSKNVKNNFGPIQNTQKNTVKNNLISKQIQLSIFDGF